MAFLKNFFKEYWLWILIPFALVVVGLGVAIWLLGDQGASPFVYNVY